MIHHERLYILIKGGLWCVVKQKWLVKDGARWIAFILHNTRRKLMQLAIEEKDLELERLNNEFNETKQTFLERNENPTEFLMKLEKSSNALTQRMNKKMGFHLQGHHEVIEFAKSKPQVKQKRKWIRLGFEPSVTNSNFFKN